MGKMVFSKLILFVFIKCFKNIYLHLKNVVFPFSVSRMIITVDLRSMFLDLRLTHAIYDLIT